MRDFVPQRTVDDCMIAAFATVTGRSYEDVAAAFGFPCNPETGLPLLRPIGGINAIEVPAPLLSLGFAASLITAKEALPGSGFNLPGSDGLKRMVQGRTAVLFITDERFPVMMNIQHALAWKDGQVIDCREAEGGSRELARSALSGAVIVSPARKAH